METRTFPFNVDLESVLYETEVPGYKAPVTEVNTPVIALVIAGCALLITAIALLSWWLSRRAAYKRWGAIRLGDGMEDDAARLMVNHKPMALQFDDVSYSLKRQGHSFWHLRHCPARSDHGHHGALQVLGSPPSLTSWQRRTNVARRPVTMLVNGEKMVDNEYRDYIGYVDQEDALLPTLTVHETILTSALLRLPAGHGEIRQATASDRSNATAWHLPYQGPDDWVGRGQW